MIVIPLLPLVAGLYVAVHRILLIGQRLQMDINTYAYIWRSEIAPGVTIYRLSLMINVLFFVAVSMAFYNFVRFGCRQRKGTWAGYILSFVLLEAFQVYLGWVGYAIGPNLDNPDRLGRRALHRAVANPWEPPAMLEWLIGQGCDVNARDSRGRTPLHELILASYLYSWDPECLVSFASKAGVLIRHGADANVADANGSTPLHLLCWWPTEESVDMVRLLLASGADPCLKDKDGCEPLAIVVEGLVSRDGEPVVRAAAAKYLLRPPRKPEANTPATATTDLPPHADSAMALIDVLVRRGADPKYLDVAMWRPEGFRMRYRPFIRTRFFGSSRTTRPPATGNTR